jgi:hypothetical protein
MGRLHFSQQTARYHRISTLDQLEIFTKLPSSDVIRNVARAVFIDSHRESGVGYQRAEQVNPATKSTGEEGNRIEVLSMSNWGQWAFGFTTIMTLMLMKQVKVDGIVGELRSQGLTVTQHSATNQTWYIKGDGIYLGYVATGDELIELKRTKNLSLLGVKSLG